MSECMKEGCNNERLDSRGSLGRFCSEDCLNAHRGESTGTSVANALADAIARIN